MQHSTNHNLKLMEATDNVRRQDFVDNFTALDNGISPFYVATENATNTYKVTTGANKTILQNGYSIRVAIPKDSTGAVSLVVDNCSAIAVKKPNGNVVTNFKQNGVYSLTYYNSVFILASGGVDDVNFSASDLLAGKTANDSNGEKINGTMANNGTKTATMALNSTITLPKGYYDGIKITQNVTTKGDITPGKSIVQSGDKVYCRMPQGAYFTNAISGYPEISYPQGDVAAALGLTANKIVAGNTIGGISGTATADGLLLTKSGTAIIAGSGGSISGSTFTDRDNYLIFNHCVDNDTHYISLFTKPSSDNRIIRLNEFSNDKTDINGQTTNGVYYYWHGGNLIYNRGNASSWDGKTFKYRIYKITDMINF